MSRHMRDREEKKWAQEQKRKVGEKVEIKWKGCMPCGFEWRPWELAVGELSARAVEIHGSCLNFHAIGYVKSQGKGHDSQK